MRIGKGGNRLPAYSGKKPPGLQKTGWRWLRKTLVEMHYVEQAAKQAGGAQ